MRLFKFLWNISPRVIVGAGICGIISGLCSTLLIVMIHRALNSLDAIGHQLIWGFVGLCALNLISAVMSQVLLIYLSEQAIFELRMRLSRDILRTPLQQLEKLGAPRLLTTLTDDVRSLSSGLLCLPIMGVQIIVMIGCLAYLGYLSVKLLGFVLVFMTLAILSYHWPVSIALTRLKKARDKQDTLFEHFEAVTQGTKELKLNRHRRHTFLTRIFEPTAQLYRRHNMIGFSLYTCAANWGYLMFFVMMGLLIFYLPDRLGLESGVLMGAALVILFMRSPLETVFTLLPEIGRSQVSLNKLEELGLSLNAHEPIPTEQGVTVSAKHLELRDVTHRYFHEGESQDFVLGPLNFRLDSGEVVFLVGGNGSGKTTLAKILVGLYQPEAGTILLDDNPVTGDRLDVYRQQFATVFSDFYLFESLLGVIDDDNRDAARDYLHKLQLNHKVEIKDDAFSTLALSQGQRKRLALVTAYLEDRPFYVFDEWAADQDPLFKELFYKTLLPELKRRGKCVFCITHDDKYFEVADRIIKLDYGQIEYVGTPQSMNPVV